MTVETHISLPGNARKGLEVLLSDLQIENHSIEIRLASEFGDNNRCILRRINIKTDDEQDLDFVIKHAPINLRYRNIYQIDYIFNREIYMYEQVFIEMLRLQEEIGIENPFNPFAKCFKTNLEAPCEYLIMEDMATRGYVPQNWKQPLDLAHCKLVMKHYGKYHALALALRDQRRDTYDKLRENTRDGYYDKDHVELLGSVIRTQCNDIICNLDLSEDAILIARINEFAVFAEKYLTRILEPEAAGGYAVFAHGDCWVNNILFKYEETNPKTPTAICILDWQRSRCTSPATDLSCFLFTATDKEMRENNYDELLSIYHESLCSFLHELGSDPNLFPFDVFSEHMRKFSKYGLAMAMVLMQLIMFDKDDVEDSVEHDVTSVLAARDKYRRSIFDRLLDVVRDFDNFGYFDS